jgi:hypothetical protein
VTCQETRGELAVAVLTRQPLTAAAAEHLLACAACAEEFARLDVLPGLLAATRDDSLPPVVVAEPALLDRLLAELRRRKRRRRVWAGAGIAASVAAVALVVSPLGATLRTQVLPGSRPTTSAPSTAPATGPASPVIAMGVATDPGSNAGATVKVRQGAWGSDLEVLMSGLAAGRQCRMVVVDAAGSRIEAGSWTIPSGRYAQDGGFHETVKTRPGDLVRAEILDDRTGKRIVVVQLTKT